jgi:hypothetical protein
MGRAAGQLYPKRTHLGNKKLIKGLKGNKTNRIKSNKSTTRGGAENGTGGQEANKARLQSRRAEGRIGGPPENANAPQVRTSIPAYYEQRWASLKVVMGAKR